MKSPLCCEMISSICDKPQGGTLHHHSDQFADILTNDGTQYPLQRRSDSEAKGPREVFNIIHEQEKSLVKGMYEYIDYQSMLKLRRKELLHKKWADNVYGPLREKIMAEMGGVNWVELDRRKRELHKQFLEYRSKKGYIFLETGDPEDYYGMALNGHRPAPLKAEVKKLNDPLHQQHLQRCEEDRNVLRCLTGSRFTDRDIEQVKLPLLPLVPLGRHGTDCSSWSTMPMRNVESEHRLASRRRMKSTTNRTSVDLSKFDLHSEQTPSLFLGGTPSSPKMVAQRTVQIVELGAVKNEA